MIPPCSFTAQTASGIASRMDGDNNVSATVFGSDGMPFLIVPAPTRRFRSIYLKNGPLVRCLHKCRLLSYQEHITNECARDKSLLYPAQHSHRLFGMRVNPW